MSGPNNPELIYLSPPLPEPMRERLRELGYAPEATRLLMLGVPISYSEDGVLVVEYPDGRRVAVERDEEFDEWGEFRRYRYRVLRELLRAAR